MNTLDSIRAAFNSSTVGLPSDAQVAMLGYSGAVIATEWAAELAPTYAPDVNARMIGAALSLAIFIPRATSPASPFRFLVLDDPIQAMDPSKIDGFLQVLTQLAENRQVIVFTHDDRLPSAIRLSRSPARIAELVRGANSVVTVTESTRPADRLLEDAFAIAVDEAVPDDIKKKAVPLLCREALEVTAWDVFSSRQFTAGNSRAELEDIWNDATTTRQRIALAVDPTNNAVIDKWLDGGSARRATMAVAAKGIHAGIRDYREAVKQARLAVEDLGRLTS